MKMIEAPSVIVVVDPKVLKPHPRNEYFFPTVGEEEDAQFIESIRERGIINMPVITTDNIIISGHRRVRAAIACGFGQIQCQQREYENDDMILYDLLASNMLSRGGIGSLFSASPVRGARVVKELSRLYGNSGNKGRNIKSPVGIDLSLPQMCEELGMSRSAVGRAIQIASIDNEVAEALDGKVKQGNLEAIGALLNPAQQKMLLDLLPENYASLTMQQFRCVINDIRDRGAEIDALNDDISTLEEKLERQVQENSRLLEMTNPNCNLDDEIRQRQEFEVKNAKLKAKVADLQIKLTKAEKAGEELETLRQQVDALKSEVASAASSVLPADYEALRDELDEAKAENERLEKENRELREMDNLAGFALANVQAMQQMVGDIHDEELHAQIGAVAAEVHKLVKRVGELKRSA